MSKSIKNNTSSQLGLSLIELLISMVIGLFLLGGVISIFVNSRDTDNMRAAISEMDSDARLAFSVMRQTIQHAGYASIHGKTLDKAFYTASDTLNNPNCRDNLARDAVTVPKTSDNTARDVITVVALGDNPKNSDALVTTDCTGEIIEDHAEACSADNMNGLGPGMASPRQAKIYSSFRLGRYSQSRTLLCKGSRGGEQVVVDNIEAMQILYGVKQDGGNAIYRSSNQIESDEELDWGNVSSVQISLLVRSARKNLLKKDATRRQYSLAGSSTTIPRSGDLRRLYRVYTSTIHLANQKQGRPLL